MALLKPQIKEILLEMLLNGDIAMEESHDVIDWEDDVLDIFSSAYIKRLNKEETEEMIEEAILGIVLSDLYDYTDMLIRCMKDNIYLGIEDYVRGIIVDILGEIERDADLYLKAHHKHSMSTPH